VADVGIDLDEALHDRPVVTPPHQDGTVGRLGKSAGEHQLAPACCLPGEAEVFVAKSGAPLEVVIDQCVLQQVEGHAHSLSATAPAAVTAMTARVVFWRLDRFYDIDAPVTTTYSP
jgi:hypothetical protein